jgi:hypothetical protein
MNRQVWTNEKCFLIETDRAGGHERRPSRTGCNEMQDTGTAIPLPPPHLAQYTAARLMSRNYCMSHDVKEYSNLVILAVL